MRALIGIVLISLTPTLCLAAETGADFNLVFDSNRSGSFGIYRQGSGDKEPVKIVDTPKHEMYPAVSPDGKLIAFARSADLEDRDGYSEVFVVNPDGSGERLVLKDATFPSFTADGKHLIVERKRRQVLKVSLADGSAAEIFPLQHPKFQRRYIVKPRLSPDESRLVFTSNLPDRWNAWAVDLKSGQAFHIGHGCQPNFVAQNDRLAWVQRGQFKGGSGIQVFEVKDSSRSSLVDFPHPHGYEYFPMPSSDGRYVAYAAAREGEHSHYDSNYQIFVADLASGKRYRITHDKYTNRWPRFMD
ncbi:MAG: PD40 domain-containing protein [Bdellovibrionales bacterium]|nr:PD40 domain-containing protein [Bdellovibrionales bacterium]